MNIDQLYANCSDDSSIEVDGFSIDISFENLDKVVVTNGEAVFLDFYKMRL